MKPFLIITFILWSTVKIHAQTDDNLQVLKQRSLDNQNPEKWNLDLLKRDLNTLKNNDSFLKDMPLYKGAFPVSDYDYFVTTNPFEIESDSYYVSGVSIGENTLEQKKIWHFSIFILSNKKNEKKSEYAESRNYPYFTGEGFFEIDGNHFDWVTASSPGELQIAFVNMKLFDLRFGKTIFIFPQQDKSFKYLQLEIDPNEFKDYESFKKTVMTNEKVTKMIGI